jgi:hypothetical protein
MHQGPDGFYLDIDFPDQIVNDFPFRVYAKKKSSGSGYDVFVRPGTANNFIPKISSTYIDSDPAPSLSITSHSATPRIVALKITQDGNKFFPATCEMVLLDSAELLVNSNTIAYLQIASISTAAGTNGPELKNIFQYIYASQVVIRVKPGSGTALWSFTSR